MDGTRRLQRFRDITSLGYFVPILLAIAYIMIMPVLARRNAALRDLTTAVGLHANPCRWHPMVSPNVMPVMVHGAGMLGRITIAGHGTQT
jgi:hypothetical protein